MLRLPVIRHVRYYWHRWRMHQHYDFWYTTTGALPVNISHDLMMLERIWRGDA